MSKKHFILTLKFLLSGGLIWMLVDGIDLGAARDRILDADPKMLWLAIFVAMIQVGISVVRWLAVLAAIGAVLSFMDGLRLHFIGFFFNQALPSSVGGDAVRIYSVYKKGMKLSSAINGVMLERVATVLGLVLILVIATPFFIDRVGPTETAWIVPMVVVLGIGGIAGLAVLMLLDQLPSRLSPWRAIRGLAMLAADTRRVFLAPIHAAKVLGWSLATHVNVAIMVYLMGLSIKLDITWFDCMVLMPPVLLVMTLPISIAGWGVREGAMITAFGLIGVPAEGALVLSIMYGLIGLLLALPGGVIWLTSSDRKGEVIDEILARDGAPSGPEGPSR
jgi:glycosyltransferase 2 family protein